MKRIIQWFKALFTHRSQIVNLTEKIDNLNEAITLLSHALVHVTTPESVNTSPEAPERPLRRVFARPTYTQMQRQFEEQHNWRIREVQEEQRRREQRAASK